MNTKIEIKINGAIPEKDYTIIRKQGEIKQNEKSKQFETEVKELLKGVKGWTSKTDPEYGEYTPLQLILKVYTPHRPVLIKQVKATLDALTGAEIYADDCAIVDLTAERIYSETEHAELLLIPADKSNISLPTGPAVVLDKYTGPVKNAVFDEKGFPLVAEDYDHDKKIRKYIRDEFHEQFTDIIDGDCEIEAIFSTQTLNKQLPLTERIAAYNFDKWTVIRPDVDNCCYMILTALNNYEYNKPEDVVKIHAMKTFYNPEKGSSRIWLKNAERPMS